MLYVFLGHVLCAPYMLVNKDVVNHTQMVD